MSAGALGQQSLVWHGISSIDSLQNHRDSIIAAPSAQAKLTAIKIQSNALRNNDSLLYAHALTIEADVNFRMGALDKASALQNEALFIFQKYNSGYGQFLSWLHLSIIDYTLGNNFRALSKLENCKQLAISTDNQELRSITQYNLAIIHINQGEYHRAEKQLSKGLGICDSGYCNPHLVEALKFRLAMIDLEYDNWLAVQKVLLKLKQYPPHIEYFYNLETGHSRLWLALGNMKKAQHFAQKAERWAEKNDLAYNHIETLLHLARVYSMAEERTLSIATTRKALSIQNRIFGNGPLKIRAMEQLAQDLVTSGDSARAVEILLSLGKLHDSISKVSPEQYVVPAAKSVVRASPDTSTASASQLSEPKKPLLVIKGDRERIIAGIILAIVVGLIVGLIPAIKMNYKKSVSSKIPASKNEDEGQSSLNTRLAELEHENNNLRELDTNKNKVFSILSHDIRQPINQVKSVLDLLSEQELSPADRKEIVQKLRDSLDNSSHALENLLLWSKKQLTGISTKLVDIHLLPQVWQLESQLKENLDAKKLKLEIHIPDFFKIYGDMSQLEICLRNLLNNAIKFSNRGGVITIDALEDNGDKVVRVIDSGVGMSEDQVSRLMSMKGDFSTVGTMNEKGTGLGVLIVREFMENQNGTLKLLSRKGEGSIFSLVFHGKPKLAETGKASNANQAD